MGRGSGSYDKYVTPLAIPLADKVLERVDVGPGTRVIDVAAGTGALTVMAARRGAKVLAADIAPGMIGRVQARVSDARLTNVDARVMDARTLDLEDDAFDVSASQLGVTVLPDRGPALREMARVPRRGGKVLSAALGPPNKAEFLGFVMAALKVSVPGLTGPPIDPPPPQFQVAGRANLSERLAEVGLAGINVETITFGLPFRSGEEFWGFLMSSNPMGRALIADLTDLARTELQEVLAGMLRDRFDGNGEAELNIDVNIGVGTK